MITLTPYTLLLFMMISILDILLSLYCFIHVFRWVYHRNDEQAIRSLLRVLNAPIVASEKLVQRFYSSDYPQWLPLFIVVFMYLTIRYTLNCFLTVSG